MIRCEQSFSFHSGLRNYLHFRPNFRHSISPLPLEDLPILGMCKAFISSKGHLLLFLGCQKILVHVTNEFHSHSHSLLSLPNFKLFEITSLNPHLKQSSLQLVAGAQITSSLLLGHY